METRDTAAIVPAWIRTYATYDAALRHGGWTTTCVRSPRPRPPSGSLTLDEAHKYGFAPVGSQRPERFTLFVLVASCHSKGYIGTAAKTYYSVWGRRPND